MKASYFLSLLFILSAISAVVATMLAIILNFNIILAVLAGILAPFAAAFAALYIIAERRRGTIEESTPDFLTQLASELRAGISLESAIDDLTKYGEGPLYDELKRTAIEIKMGRSFESSLIAMANRLKSEQLNRTFRMISEGRRAGASLSRVLESVAEDLRQVLALKRERKSNVMMYAMFFLIAGLFGAPLVVGLISIVIRFFIDLYSASGAIAGMTLVGNVQQRLVNLRDPIQIACGGYVAIHAFLGGILLGTVMYGDPKKGLKYSIPMALVAFAIYYFISTTGYDFISSFGGGFKGAYSYSR